MATNAKMTWQSQILQGQLVGSKSTPLGTYCGMPDVDLRHPIHHPPFGDLAVELASEV
jgi:hypothetical protein